CGDARLAEPPAEPELDDAALTAVERLQRSRDGDAILRRLELLVARAGRRLLQRDDERGRGRLDVLRARAGGVRELRVGRRTAEAGPELAIQLRERRPQLVDPPRGPHRRAAVAQVPP